MKKKVLLFLIIFLSLYLFILQNVEAKSKQFYFSNLSTNLNIGKYEVIRINQIEYLTLTDCAKILSVVVENSKTTGKIKLKDNQILSLEASGINQELKFDVKNNLVEIKLTNQDLINQLELGKLGYKLIKDKEIMVPVNLINLFFNLFLYVQIFEENGNYFIYSQEKFIKEIIKGKKEIKIVEEKISSELKNISFLNFIYILNKNYIRMLNEEEQKKIFELIKLFYNKIINTSTNFLYYLELENFIHELNEFHISIIHYGHFIENNEFRNAKFYNNIEYVITDVGFELEKIKKLYEYYETSKPINEKDCYIIKQINQISLEPDDLLLNIDSKSLENLMLINSSIDKIISLSGGIDSLVLVNKESMEPIDVTRKNIKRTNRTKEDISKEIDDEIGYIKIPDWNFTNPDTELLTELKESFDKFSDKELIILDLRWNLGGIQESVNEILRYLINEDISYSVKDKYNNIKEINIKKLKDIKNKFLILINKESYSASTIFAAIVKENKLGKIIGEKTSGGIYASSFYITLPDKTIISVPVENMFYGENFGHYNKGIEPDIFAEDIVINGVDNILDTSIKYYKNHLK